MSTQTPLIIKVNKVNYTYTIYLSNINAQIGFVYLMQLDCITPWCLSLISCFFLAEKYDNRNKCAPKSLTVTVIFFFSGITINIKIYRLCEDLWRNSLLGLTR